MQPRLEKISARWAAGRHRGPTTVGRANLIDKNACKRAEKKSALLAKMIRYFWSRQSDGSIKGLHNLHEAAKWDESA
jgi:hypothetical protein